MHQSLGDIFGDLQSKDLQLTLAMQDLSIATEEIKQAAEFRSRLECLERYIILRLLYNGNFDKPIDLHVYILALRKYPVE